MIENKEIAIILLHISRLLALRKEDPFKIVAYLRASQTIEQLPRQAAQMAKDGSLKQIRGIGEALTSKINELLETGKLEYYEQLLAETPIGLTEMAQVSGLGPAKVNTLWTEAGIDSLDSLEQACESGQLLQIKGFGQKTIDKLLLKIEQIRKVSGKMLLSTARPLGERLLELLSASPEVIRCSLAGELRRGCEVVEQVDLLLSSESPQAVIELISGLRLTARVLQSDPSGVRFLLPGGLRAEIRIVADETFPVALQHFTGSPAHNARLRELARAQGVTIDQSRALRGNDPLPVADEAALFEIIGLAEIPPELRENLGEFEQPIPELVRFNQLRGTFHCHTVYSDGLGTVEQMALSARELGWQYLGISDHSQTSSFAGGLLPEKLEAQMDEIDALNEQWTDFELLKGSEVDILPDGQLDFPDALLERLDFVIASIHSNFSMSLEEMMPRMLAAVRHPLVNFIAHPTGRLLLKRAPYQLDLQQLIEEAAATGTCLEINSSPKRLDIDWVHARKAAALGIPISINPDAHQPSTLLDVRYGVTVARRAWMTPEQVLNTRAWSEIKPLFAAKRARSGS